MFLAPLPRGMRILACSALSLCVLLGGCSEEAGNEPDPSDLQSDTAGATGVPDTFDPNEILAQELFEAGEADLETSAAAVQAFLENTPYHRRSWLADETIDGIPASDLIAQAAAKYELNPLMLLVRMQVERSLIGKSTRPSQSSIDVAMSCGCETAATCAPSLSGLVNQLGCAARTLRHWNDASADPSQMPRWRAGVTHTSEDGVPVTPQNDATASMYAYTPFVLPQAGGNWLVWNVTHKYARFVETELQK